MISNQVLKELAILVPTDHIIIIIIITLRYTISKGLQLFFPFVAVLLLSTLLQSTENEYYISQFIKVRIAFFQFVLPHLILTNPQGS